MPITSYIWCCWPFSLLFFVVSVGCVVVPAGRTTSPRGATSASPCCPTTRPKWRAFGGSPTRMCLCRAGETTGRELVASRIEGWPYPVPSSRCPLDFRGRGLQFPRLESLKCGRGIGGEWWISFFLLFEVQWGLLSSQQRPCRILSLLARLYRVVGPVLQHSSKFHLPSLLLLLLLLLLLVSLSSASCCPHLSALVQHLTRPISVVRG